jgi:seryl-tRNA synthetase
MNVGVARQVATEDACDSLAHELFRPMGVDGVYARTGLLEQVVDGLAALITRHREPNTEVLRFPPVMSRRMLERSGYLKTFPNLLGCVSCLEGSEAEICGIIDRFEAGKEWTDALAPADLVLSPASCYPVYPIAAERGIVPAGGLSFDVAAECFRREPSRNLDRMQSFRMREYVSIGTPEKVADFRAGWMTRITAIADQLHLAHRVDPASDPFFGRGGMFMAKTQVEKSLKFELLIPLRSADAPTACMSVNYHRDHFANIWGLTNAAGDVSHTSCVAFGMDRLALAMFAVHGVKLAHWPTAVLSALRLQS